MKTREQMYSQEAASLLRDITMYRALLEKQLLRLYPGKEEKIPTLLAIFFALPFNSCSITFCDFFATVLTLAGIALGCILCRLVLRPARLLLAGFAFPMPVRCFGIAMRFFLLCPAVNLAKNRPASQKY